MSKERDKNESIDFYEQILILNAPLIINTQLAIYMGHIWVPYGLAYVNKINSRSRGGSRISCSGL